MCPTRLYGNKAEDSQTAADVFSKRILQLLRYFDNFDYPQTALELSELLGASRLETEKKLQSLCSTGWVEKNQQYYCVPGKAKSIELRAQGETYFRHSIPRILRSARILACFPHVRGIFLTGSASRGVLDPGADIDFFIITSPGKVWLTRTLITFWRKWNSRNYRTPAFKYYCCNHYLGADHLRFALKDQNRFVALELASCRPMFDPMGLHERFLAANRWMLNYFQPRQVNPYLLVHALFPGLQKLQEGALGLFWTQKREQSLREKHFRHWLGNRNVSNREEFDRRTGEYFIKNDAGQRQAFLLSRFSDQDPDRPRDALRTAVQLKKQTTSQGGKIPAPDLLLTHAYFLNKTRLEKKMQKPYLPLGPLSVAAYVREQGFGVEFYDTTFTSGPEALGPMLLNKRISLVGIFIMETTRTQAIAMIKICRAMGVVVLVGGPDPSNDPKLYLAAGAQAVVVGEGEITVTEFLQELRTPTRPLSSLPGLVTQLTGHFQPRAHIKHLAGLPQPARDLADLSAYVAYWKKHHGYASLLITASRGCPYACHWCSKPVFGSSYRLRPPAEVVTEMKWLQQKYQPDQMWFTDDIFGLNREWLAEFRVEVEKQNAVVRFECLSRVDIMDENSLQQLRASGCFRIWYGAESGSQKIIDHMNKNFKVEQIRAAAALTRQHGIQVGFFIMLGYPSEKTEDLEATRSLLREACPDHVGIAIVYPYSGTQLFTEVASQLKHQQLPARVENDFKLVFHSRYPQWFYTLVRKYFAKEALAGRMPVFKLIFWGKHLVYRQLYERARAWLSKRK